MKDSTPAAFVKLFGSCTDKAKRGSRIRNLKWRCKSHARLLYCYLRRCWSISVTLTLTITHTKYTGDIFDFSDTIYPVYPQNFDSIFKVYTKYKLIPPASTLSHLFEAPSSACTVIINSSLVPLCPSLPVYIFFFTQWPKLYLNIKVGKQYSLPYDIPRDAHYI